MPTTSDFASSSRRSRRFVLTNSSVPPDAARLLTLRDADRNVAKRPGSDKARAVAVSSPVSALARMSTSKRQYVLCARRTRHSIAVAPPLLKGSWRSAASDADHTVEPNERLRLLNADALSLLRSPVRDASLWQH